MTTVNNFADILRIIREQPEWGEALRSALLSRELLEMPQTLAEFARATNQRLAALEGDVGNLKGGFYELKVGNNIQSIIGQHTNIIPIRVLKGPRANNDMAYLNPIYEAKRKGVITERERVAAFAVDIVVEGRREADDATLFIVVEVSRTIGDSDVNRASDRANIVQRATGKQASPAVIGVFVDQVRRELAEEQNVTVICYGE